MFKRLKQKIEEGGEGGLEKVSFSHKLPGSIVRSTSESDGKLHSSSPQLLEDPPELVSSPVLTQGILQKGEFPSHLSFKSHSDYQHVLEARIIELEQECNALNEQLGGVMSLRLSERSSFEARIKDLDEKGVEMKMQVIELEVEMEKRQQQYEATTSQLKDKLSKQAEEAIVQHSLWMKERSQLKVEIDEKEKCMISEENRYRILEKKAHHLESQLHAYENSSENEVVNRLHHEVADVEQRVKSRNLEIQILERRLASQAKENEEQVEKLLSKQEELEKVSKDLAQVIRGEKNIKRELTEQLDITRQRNAQIDRENEDLKLQLTANSQALKSLKLECEQSERSCNEKIQELENVIEDKEKYIKNLLHQLMQLKGEVIMQTVPYPPGVARRTASIGVQTLPHYPDVSNEPAILPPATHDSVALQEADTSPATMASLNSGEALEVMKEQQFRLEEELSEKLKIIKVQQQKIMDIKKELRLQKTSALLDDSVCGSQLKRSPSPPAPATLRLAIASDVNFQYLKHVVIKFMCSREDEALQLIRAVSTLLEFTQQEEQHVKSYLNYKMSWFGVTPPPLFTPMQSAKFNSDQ